MSTAIDIQDVSKHFRLYKEKYTSLKERVLHAGQVPFEEFWALKDVNLEIGQGETLGILGRNGSGKSTLLKCIAGILQPSSGQILVRGHLAAMLELGAGFQPELSGRDNIFLNASLLGLSRKEIERSFDEIVAFAELEEFIDNQVRFYSSGMYVRLGFAVAVNVNPDVLLVDEVLAVGDERFQQKCMDRIHRFQEEGRTIVVVSHAADAMRHLCNRVAVIDAGHLITVAPPGEAIRTFRERLIDMGEPPPPLPEIEVGEAEGTAEPDEGGQAAPAGPSSVVPRARRVKITGSRLELPAADRSHVLPGESLTLVLEVSVRETLRSAAIGCSVYADDGSLIFDCDSVILGDHLDLEAGDSTIHFEFREIPLLDGRYSVNVRVQDGASGVIYARQEPAATFDVVNPGQTTGLVLLPLTVNVKQLHGDS
jgi:ABC-2 type transport system ATP-binding protein